MVEKLKNIAVEIKREKGGVFVFALLKMDELTDKWSVILSAPWISEGDSDEIFKYVLSKFKKELSPEELSSIARLGLLGESEHLVELLLQYRAGTEIRNKTLNGNEIHEGYILESSSDAKALVE